MRLIITESSFWAKEQVQIKKANKANKKFSHKLHHFNPAKINQTGYIEAKYLR